ncbi:hypothetical protein BKA80DRAFT_282755 [Phyllosticta citrichinensis]
MQLSQLQPLVTCLAPLVACLYSATATCRSSAPPLDQGAYLSTPCRQRLRWRDVRYGAVAFCHTSRRLALQEQRWDLGVWQPLHGRIADNIHPSYVIIDIYDDKSERLRGADCGTCNAPLNPRQSISVSRS